MAGRAEPLIRGGGGGIAAALCLALMAGPLLAVALRAGDSAGLGPGDWAAIRFTVTQAALSPVLSVALAVPAARALMRRRFPGRGLAITLLGAPFLLPTLVAVMGLLAVFGRNGLVSQGLALLGLPPLQIYGFHGVVLGHVFFNLPLVTRLLLQGWQGIPAERLRLSESLGFGPRETFRHLELPMLARVVPGALLVVFLICTTSFAVALTLGGGPRATTVELAIYQAFRFDFDLGRAAMLAGVQVALCVAAVLALRLAPLPVGAGTGLDRRAVLRPPRGTLVRLQDTVVIGLVLGFLLLPLTMLVVDGLPGLVLLPDTVWAAALRSLAVALGSVAVTLALAVPLAFRLAGARALWVEVAANLSIAVSPLVLGLGLFLIVLPLVDPRLMALPVTALVNALLSLPFVLRALVPAIHEVNAGYGRLAASLGMGRADWLRLVVLPRVRGPLGFGAGLAAALSIGDLGVITLFADGARETLPLALFRLMGAYRLTEAAGAALVLLGLTLAVFWIFDRGGRGRAGL